MILIKTKQFTINKDHSCFGTIINQKLLIFISHKTSELDNNPNFLYSYNDNLNTIFLNF